MRFLLVSLFLSACVAQQNAGTACSDIEDACEIFEGKGGTGDDCHDAAHEGTEATCRATLAKCLAFCKLDDAPEVIAAYAQNVHAAYETTVTATTAMQAAIATFVAAPSQAGFDAAKAAWKSARVPYQQTEAFRFYDGPIDNAETGPEGRINSWPLDEAFIDYTAAAPNAGLINDTVGFPAVFAAAIAEKNEAGGETNISAGYHAVEFLLWGQDFDANGPGNRPYTDYVVGAGGTAQNQDRRGQYLKAIGDLLVSDLTMVRDAWAPTAAYRKAFEADDTRASLRKILTGMGSLTKGELRGERLNVAYESKDQEDEHSCFSDTTIVDYANSARGIQNVYLGMQGGVDGPGVDDLVAARDPDLDAKMRAQLAATVAAIEAIATVGPFDQAILGADSTPGRQKIKAALDALAAQAKTIQDVAALLGVDAVDDTAGVTP